VVWLSASVNCLQQPMQFGAGNVCNLETCRQREAFCSSHPLIKVWTRSCLKSRLLWNHFRMQEWVSILTQLLRQPAGSWAPSRTAHVGVASSATHDPHASRNSALEQEFSSRTKRVCDHRLPITVRMSLLGRGCDRPGCKWPVSEWVKAWLTENGNNEEYF